MPETRTTRLLTDPEDEKTFQTMYGAFTLRRPSLWLQREIHKEAARSLEGLTNVDTMGELTNLAMVTVTVCARGENQRATEVPRGFPKDFTWQKAYDIDFLTGLYNEFSKWVSSFRRTETTGGDKEGSERTEPVESVPAAQSVQLGAKEQ